jgi:DNA-binding MarR family transcriptional regulator
MNNRSIGFLNGVIHRGAHRYFEQELRGLGLHRGMIHILKELSRRDGITQQELCESLWVDKANVTRILGRMETAGLVTRTVSINDGRAKRIHLTEEGRAVLIPLDALLQKWNGILTRNMNDEEINTLKSLLLQSISGIEKYLSETGPG